MPQLTTSKRAVRTLWIKLCRQGAGRSGQRQWLGRLVTYQRRRATRLLSRLHPNASRLPQRSGKPKRKRARRLNTTGNCRTEIQVEPNARTEAKSLHKLAALLRYIDDSFPSPALTMKTVTDCQSMASSIESSMQFRPRTFSDILSRGPKKYGWKWTRERLPCSVCPEKWEKCRTLFFLSGSPSKPPGHHLGWKTVRDLSGVQSSLQISLSFTFGAV